jgi:O-antigen/teichoic acid export membrane protein
MRKSAGGTHDERGLARLSSGVLVTNVLAAVALLGTSVLTARAFGPEGRGELSLATQFVTLVATLGSLGLIAAAAYHSARAKWSKPVAFGSSTLLGLLLGLVILGGCCLVILVGNVTFNGLPESYLALASLALPFLLAVLAIQAVYQGFRDFKEFNRITLAQAALPLVLIGIAVGVGGGVRAAILATVAAAALLFLAVLANVQRSVGFAWRLKLADLRELVSFGLRVHPANVLAYLGYRLDIFLVDGYKGAAAVGLYGAGVVIAEGLWMPSQAVSTALFPTIAAETSESARLGITPFVARSTLWLTAILGGLLVLVAGPVVDLLYTSSFSASAAVIRILVPGIVLFSAARVLSNDIAARGRPLVNSVIAAASVVSNIALNIVLIPRYGIDGAAWASTGSYSLLFLATATVYRRVTRVPMRALVVPTRDDGPRYVRLIKHLGVRQAVEAPVEAHLASVPTEELVVKDPEPPGPQ